MTILIVDWLGRGGIAQTSESWATELRAEGHEVMVSTRPGRELADDVAGPDDTGSDRGGRWAAHLRLVRRTARAIEEHRPAMVVVQNYVIPSVELVVLQAARRNGARVVFVAHNHRAHSRLSGSSLGLRHWLTRSDDVVAHSEFVAARLPDARNIRVFPLPLPLGLLGDRSGRSVVPEGDTAVALHFGVLKRRYKNTATVTAMARHGVSGWRFVAIGTGAPVGEPNLHSVDGFVSAGMLRATVASADVSLLPYTAATQSSAVAVSQSLGSVPIATDVGGIGEQIESGTDGVLLHRDAPVDEWCDALAELSDPGRRAALAANARRRACAAHEHFRSGVLELAPSVVR